MAARGKVSALYFQGSEKCVFWGIMYLRVRVCMCKYVSVYIHVLVCICVHAFVCTHVYAHAFSALREVSSSVEL